MPLFNSSLITSAAADSTPADPVTRSLRFNDADNSALYIEPTVNHDSSTVFTFSCWAKLGEMGVKSSYTIFCAGDYPSATNQVHLHLSFMAAGTLRVSLRSQAATSTSNYPSTAVFRDPSAWYHILMVRDGASLKVYVNNSVVITATINATTDYGVGSGRPMHVGSNLKHTQSAISSYYSFDGLLADVYFTDGYAKAPTDFIEDAGYGAYKPKAYTGSFGTNGFHIDAQPAHDADLLVSSIDRNDGDTLFADAAKGHTITKGGDPEHSIAVGNPFTGDDRAIVFNPSNNDMLEIASSSDFQFGTGDFTIEGWYNFRHLTGDQVICDLRPSNTSDSTRPSFSTAGAGLKMHFAGGNTTLASSGLVIGKWHHIEISRSSNTLYCFIDGTQTYSNTFSNDLNTDCTPHLGSTDTNNQVAFLDGYVFDYHILKGFGRNTSNFTVPTEKSTKDSTYTVLLLQPDKDDTGFDDLSDSDHTITATGSPTRTASTPYDAAAKSTAMYFDGSGDYLNIGTSSDFRVTSNNFTLDFWYKAIDDWGNVFSNTPDGNVYDGFEARCSTSGVRAGFRNSSSSNDSLSLEWDTSSDTDWHHVEVSRTGSNVYLFIDGTLEDSGTLSFTPTDSGVAARIGRRYGNSYPTSNNYEGYLFDYRWSNSGGHTASFTAPSAPLELNPVYIGGDQSGNKNHFTPTNISSHDVMLDVPYPKNYATWNPLDLQETASTAPTFTEGNLSLSTNSSGYGRVHSTISLPSTGKWYAEFYSTSFDTIGVRRKVGGGWPSGSSDLASVSSSGSIINASGTSQSGLASWSSGDILGVEVNCDDNTIQFLRNGSNYGTSESFTHYAGETFFTYTDGSSGTAYSAIANFGQDPTFAGNYTGTPESSEWAHSPSNGFNSLNTSNLDDPTVTPEENFGILTYAGTGSSRSVPLDGETGLDFQPDLVWLKDRTTGGSGGFHCIHDSVRGDDGTHKYILSSDNTQITTDTTYSGYGVTSFNSDGFSIIGGGSLTNDSSRNYVAWNWKAHQTPPTTYNYSTTLTLTVTDQYGSQDYTGWGTTELEVFEGTQSLGTVGQPTGYNTSDSTVQTVWEIKTDNSDHSKIKVVWKTVDTSSDGSGGDRFNNIEVVLTDSSSNELASWYPSNYYGGGGYGPDAPEAGDVFRAQTSSADESTTGVLEVQQPTVESNSEKYNAAAGFTMFTYTGNSSTNNDTMLFNHSLGAPIDFAIGKCRSTPASGTSGGNWVVWHKDLSYDYYSLYLNQSESENDVGSNNYDTVTYDSAGWFANESTGSQHHVKIRNVEIYDGNNTDTVRMVDNSKDFVFYGFAGVEGYSKFGSYTGNLDADGPFIYTGFRPAFVMIKNIDNSSVHWNIHDSARDTHNLTENRLSPNNSNDEDTGWDEFDFLSNGFKAKAADTGNNGNGNTIIYAAFAESPFKHANAR